MGTGDDELGRRPQATAEVGAEDGSAPEPDEDVEEAVGRAARAVGEAKALVVTAGAGMGVDSGLPDFRGTEGFWRAYPPFAELGLRFEEMANPSHFSRDPHLAWGFYGHRLNLYRDSVPHPGFEVLRRWVLRAAHGGFVFTSNVDGHFQRAGFSPARVVECHGSILHLQCSGPCSDMIWSADGIEVEVDRKTFRAAEPLPRCPACGEVARPNVLMFGDWLWIARRTAEQEARFRAWLDGLGETGDLTVVELGAGTSVPTVRLTSEHLHRRPRARLVRINPREPEAPQGAVSLPMRAREALEAIDALLARPGDSGGPGGLAGGAGGGRDGG